MSIKAAATLSSDQSIVEAVARGVLVRRQEFVDSLVERIKFEIGDLSLPDLDRWLIASVAENTSTLISVLHDGNNPRTAAVPHAAVEYAVRLAQNDTSVASLLRAYRFGQAQFTQLCLEVAADCGLDQQMSALRLIIDLVAAFIDHVCEVVSVAYEEERERWVRSRSGVRQHLVNAILQDDLDDVRRAETMLAYPLDAYHLGVEAWVVGSGGGTGSIGLFDHLTSVLASYFDARGKKGLLLPIDEHDARLWFAVPQGGPLRLDGLAEHLSRERVPVHLAIGDPHQGLAGFRRTHWQASRTKVLARSIKRRPPTVTTFADVAPVALLRDDPLEIREFVHRTLGSLAVNDDRHYGLRESLLVFLECNRSYAAAAERLIVHRNTVRYRVEQAIKELGTDLDDNPLNLLLSLSAAKWLPSLDD